MNVPTPPTSVFRQLRNKIAHLQRDNRHCNYKASELMLLVEGMLHSVSDAIKTIEAHEHNDTVLMVLEADLAELLVVVNDKVLGLEQGE